MTFKFVVQPEHYDLENASSIAPSDIDIIYHYKVQLVSRNWFLALFFINIRYAGGLFNLDKGII